MGTNDPFSHEMLPGSSKPRGPHRRRSGDFGDGKTREELLEDMLEHGSKSFQRYKRRTQVLFAVLVAVTVFSVWFSWNQSNDAREDLAYAIAEQQYDGCVSGKELRDGIIETLILFTGSSSDPRIKQARDFIGQGRSCNKLKQEIWSAGRESG